MQHHAAEGFSFESRSRGAGVRRLRANRCTVFTGGVQIELVGAAFSAEG